MIVYLAAMRSIPNDYYEAAELDGASYWTKLRKITLPMLSPTTLFLFVTTFLSSMQVGRQPWRHGESGGRVSNAWTTDPPDRDSRGKLRIIPGESAGAQAPAGRAAAAAPGDGSASYQLDGGVKAHRGDDG